MPGIEPTTNGKQVAQNYLDEGLYEGPPSSVEVSMMKIPRPKHCSRHSDLFQSSNESGNGEAPFHSDNYLQAASKNKRRTSKLSMSGADPHIKHTNNHSGHFEHSKVKTSQPQTEINLREMYTNRAFKD